MNAYITYSRMADIRMGHTLYEEYNAITNRYLTWSIIDKNISIEKNFIFKKNEIKNIVCVRNINFLKINIVYKIFFKKHSHTRLLSSKSYVYLFLM